MRGYRLEREAFGSGMRRLHHLNLCNSKHHRTRVRELLPGVTSLLRQSSLVRTREPAFLLLPQENQKAGHWGWGLEGYLLARGRRAAEAGVTAVRAVRHGCNLPASPTLSQMPLGDLFNSWLPFLTARGPPAHHLPQVPPLLAQQLPPTDPCVLLSLGCRGTAPHRDISLALGLAHRPSLVVSGNSSWKSHGRKRQQVRR